MNPIIQPSPAQSPRPPQRTQPGPAPAPRHKTPSKEGPYCWQSKTALRRIRLELSDEGAAYPLLTYLALTEIASDKEEPVFTVSIEDIAKMAAVSAKTAERALKLLKAIHAVGVEPRFIPGTKIKRPSQYTIFTDTTESRYIATGGESDSCESHPIEERIEERIEKPKKKPRAKSVRPSIGQVEEYAVEIKAHLGEVKAFFDHYEANGWKQKGGNPIVNWKCAFNGWLRRAAQFAPKNTTARRHRSESTQLAENLEIPILNND